MKIFITFASNFKNFLNVIKNFFSVNANIADEIVHSEIPGIEFDCAEKDQLFLFSERLTKLKNEF